MTENQVREGYVGEIQTAGFKPAPGFFNRMLVISLILHMACFMILQISRNSARYGSAITYLELGDTPGSSASPAGRPAPTPAMQAQESGADNPVSPENQSLPTGQPESTAGGEALQQASLAYGISLGYFRGLGEGESLKDDIREYYFRVLQKFNEKWWLAGGGKLKGVRQDAAVNVFIGRDGTILEKRLIRSSGSSEYDRSVLKALDAASPLPSLPASYERDIFQAPIRIALPLNLMASGLNQPN